jgi:uncharacterized membrane protein
MREPSDHWSNSVCFRLVLITALALGIYFRLSGLGNKIYSHDETFTSLHAAGYRTGDAFTGLWDSNYKSIDDIQRFLKPGKDKGIADTLSSITSSGPQQAPLFFLLAYFWIRVVDSTPAAIRGLAAIFGCLSIPSIFFLCKELFNSDRIALISTTIFSISPFHILFAQDARFYSLWTFATIVSSTVLLQAIKKSNLITWLSYSLTLILGLYSHLLFILIIIVHALYFAAIHLFSHPQKYGGFLSACLASTLAYTPWLFKIFVNWWRVAGNMDWLNMQTSWYRYIQRWTLLFSSPFLDLDFSSDIANFMSYLLRGLIMIFIAFALLYFLKHASRQAKLFLLLIYVITAGSFIMLDLLFGGIRSVTGRYFVPANIATILVIAYFLADKFDLSKGRSGLQWKLGFVLLLLGGILSNVNSLLAETWWNKELGRIRTEFVHEIDRDGTLLVVTGTHPTNLGDVLLLGFEVDSDVQFRLFKNPEDMDISGSYNHVYWFPSSSDEVTKIIGDKGIDAREVIQDTLWRIESNPGDNKND